MNSDGPPQEGKSLSVLYSPGQLAAETLDTALGSDNPLEFVDRSLRELTADKAGDELPMVQLALRSLGALLLGQKLLNGADFSGAMKQLAQASTGFEQIGQQELCDLALGLKTHCEAVIAIQEKNIGQSVTLLSQAQDHLRRAGKFGQQFEQLIEQFQPNVFFAKAMQAITNLDYAAAKPLVEQASQSAFAVANKYYKEGTREHSYNLGMAYAYRAFYTSNRAFNDFNLYNFDGLIAEIDLRKDAAEAKEHLSKAITLNDAAKILSHACDGMLELFDLLIQLSPIMQMVFNSTYRPEPHVGETLRQKIRRAHDSFAMAGPLATSMLRNCDRLARQIENLERLAKPKPVATTGLSIVILVHGIRTFAGWQDILRAEFERAGLKVELTNYEYFDLVRFLLPFRGFRTKIVQSVLHQIRTVQVLHPGARISILAHSFGTYVVAEILRDQIDIKIDRLLFCGSIVPSSYPFHQVMARIEASNGFINDVGSRDIWPALAESVTLGYGRTGTYGFHSPGVRDRWHDLPHSGFLTAEFCRKYWIPFFLNGTQVESEKIDKGHPVLLRLISVFKIKYILSVLLVVLIWWIWSLWRMQ